MKIAQDLLGRFLALSAFCQHWFIFHTWLVRYSSNAFSANKRGALANVPLDWHWQMCRWTGKCAVGLANAPLHRNRCPRKKKNPVLCVCFFLWSTFQNTFTNYHKTRASQEPQNWCKSRVGQQLGYRFRLQHAHRATQAVLHRATQAVFAPSNAGRFCTLSQSCRESGGCFAGSSTFFFYVSVSSHSQPPHSHSQPPHSPFTLPSPWPAPSRPRARAPAARRRASNIVASNLPARSRARI